MISFSSLLSLTSFLYSKRNRHPLSEDNQSKDRQSQLEISVKILSSANILTVNVPGGIHLIFESIMHLNKRPPSYASEANNASFPPPAYAPKTNDENENTEFNETSSYRRLDFDALDSFMNSGGHHATDDNRRNSNHNNNNSVTHTAPPRSDSWFERMFQVNTRGYHTFTKVDTQMGNWSVICIAIQCVAATILLCVSGVAIKLYQNPWNQSSVIGGATLSYALAGSILSCVTVRS